MAKILLIDDDITLVDGLRGALEKEGWTVETALNGEDGLQMLQSFIFDMVLLDWQMPDIDGLVVLNRFRASGGITPVIFLTGRQGVDNKESGLDSGADDYLTKPFDVRELLARIRSVQRRANSVFQKDLSQKNVNLELKLRILRWQDKMIKLSATETSILEFFFMHPDEYFSAAQVFDRVWPSETEAKVDTVRVHLHVLKRKLSLAGFPELVDSIQGSGYILRSTPN